MSENFSPETDNIVSVPSTAVTSVLRTRVLEFIDKCPTAVAPGNCASIDAQCRTDVLLWIPGGNALMKSGYGIDHIVSARNIEAVAFSTRAGDRMELYLCTCPQNTELVLKLMLYVGIQYSPARIVWAAIPPETLYFEYLVDYLVENGFKHPTLTSETMLGEYLPSPVVALTLDKYDPVYTPSAMLDAKNIRNTHLAAKRMCSFDIRIPSDVADELKEFLDESVEVGGKLIVTEYQLKYFDGRYVPVATLGFPTKSQVKGDRGSVYPPTGFFNFHTHPYHCYREYNCSLGWPSNTDMGAVFKLREEGNIVHFVITMEGIYGVQITPQFGLYLDMVKQKDYLNYGECMNGAQKAIFDFMDPFNAGRVIDPQLSDSRLHEYLQVINNIMFSDIARAVRNTACEWVAPPTDFRAYSVTFMNWTEIEYTGSFQMESQSILSGKNAKCPPSIGDELEAAAGGEISGLK